jgi:hypothetical protein
MPPPGPEQRPRQSNSGEHTGWHRPSARPELLVHSKPIREPNEVAQRVVLEGFRAAADQVCLVTPEVVGIRRSEGTRLFRAGANNPPLRGTLLELTRQHGVLCSVGTGPF